MHVSLLTTLFPPRHRSKRPHGCWVVAKNANAKTASIHSSSEFTWITPSLSKKRLPYYLFHPPFHRYERPLCARPPRSSHLSSDDGFPFALSREPSQRTFFRPSCLNVQSNHPYAFILAHELEESPEYREQSHCRRLRALSVPMRGNRHIRSGAA